MCVHIYTNTHTQTYVYISFSFTLSQINVKNGKGNKGIKRIRKRRYALRSYVQFLSELPENDCKPLGKSLKFLRLLFLHL